MVSRREGLLQFSSQKARVLEKVDLSRKGSVDDAIMPMVKVLNSTDEYYTTSSCSGRISIFSEDSKQRKKGCHWLLTSHDPIDLPQLLSALGTDLPGSGYVYFKFEPFVLHVMCRTLPDAQTLLQTAIGSGFRNSGIMCGKKGKIMLAVRSTHSLEAPVAFDGSLIVSREYLAHLVEIGNTKLLENLHRVNSTVKHIPSNEKLSEGLETRLSKLSFVTMLYVERTSLVPRLLCRVKNEILGMRLRFSEQLEVELSKRNDSEKQLCNSPPRPQSKESRDVGHHPGSEPAEEGSTAKPHKGTMDTCSEDEELLLTELFTIPS